MKKWYLFLFFVFSVNAFATPKAIQGKLLDIDFKLASIKALNVMTSTQFKAQHTIVWCWAASAAMVIQQQTGRWVEDCTILSDYFRVDCCGAPQRCMRPGGVQEVRTLLAGYGVPNNVIPSGLNFQQIAHSINANKPIIAWLMPSSPNEKIGHVVVIAGYEPNGLVYVYDPFNGQSLIPYQALFQYGPNRLYWSMTNVI